MAKAFSKGEMETIRQKLIESCRICWERYGYKRTNVAELASMSGVSAGAFYSFFPSKEMLFIETSNDFAGKLYLIFWEGKPEHPTKSDLAKALKMIIHELKGNSWIFSLREDYAIFLRKLPDNFLEQEYRKDLVDVSEIVKLYELTPKASIPEITSVVYTVILSLYFSDVIGENHQFAMDFLIDAAVENLFE
jgi:AcrR family transcriptional regulator